MMSCGVETELSLLEDNRNGMPNINWNDTFTSNNKFQKVTESPYSNRNTTINAILFLYKRIDLGKPRKTSSDSGNTLKLNIVKLNN
jgi:hypothetical protein